MKENCKEFREGEYWGKENEGVFVKSEFMKKIERFITRCKDLVEAQRSTNIKQANEIAKEALHRVYCTLRSRDIDWRELTQDKFDKIFGVRQIVMAGGLGTRYSLLIHKAVATGGTGKSNIELAMEGSFGSPTIVPLIIVNPKILGLAIKGEFLEGYNKEIGSFKIKKGVLKQLEYQLMDVKSIYIDRVLLKRYFGRDDILLCYLPVPLGPGGDLLQVAKMLCERGYETPYIEIVYGEMSTSVLPEYINASLTAYLKILGEGYAAVGGKESKGRIELKGNFAFNKGKLAAHEDWERIPHEECNKEEQKGFDRVLEQQGDNYRIVRNRLAEVRKQHDQGELDDEELLEQVQELRDKYPYFVISDEGELFCQEKLLEVRDKLKNWSKMSDKEKEYIKRNYAVVETRTEREEAAADLMISANVGIYKTSVIAGFYDELMKEFDEQGYREYHETLRRGEPVDNRQVGRFWGVDWKTGRSKAILWSFSRIIQDWWSREHPGEEVPIAFIDVTGAPSSIKNPERQFKFTNRYIKIHKVKKEAKIDIKWSQILMREEGELERELLDLLESDIDSYRKSINELFLISRNNVEQQIKVFSTLRKIEENAEKNKDVKGIKSPPELIHGFHWNAVVEAIDRDYFGPELIIMMSDRTVKEAVAHYFLPLYSHPGAGYIRIKLDRLFREAQEEPDKEVDVRKIIEAISKKPGGEPEMKITHDVRPFLRERVKKALKNRGRAYFVREGGFASVDVNMGIDKAVALNNLVKGRGIDLEASMYFGDEFELNGNDTPVTKLKEGGKNSRFCIISVGLMPPADGVTGVEWVGGGTERTKGILKRILKGLKTGEDDIVIDVLDDENRFHAEVKVDLKELREGGALIFDVDGTILQRKEFTFYNDEEIRDIFKTFLKEGITVGIISGNSRVEQSSRIVRPLEEAGSSLEGLVLYANGGATRIEFREGKENVENLAGSIPWEDIEVIKGVAEECAREQFGLNAEELMAWRDFYGAKEDGIGKREGFPELDARWMNKKEEWAMGIVSAEDIKEEKVERVSCPWIEVKDGVQVSIKLLPKRLEIPAETLR